MTLDLSPEAPTTGDIIAGYRVVSELGSGGMATVLEVIDESTGEHRAMKIIRPGRNSAEVARRFRREFRALSRLSHPNVLRVFEGGMEDDRLYYVMELLPGHTLTDEVEAWRDLPPSERFEKSERVLVQVAQALEYIHSRGLVHRDVTPGNIMMLPDGTARLMDFGVVKEPGAELTQVGELVGTVTYMAPEQIMGERVDPRADLYSLGAVLYFMLTGERPFKARTVAGYLEKHLKLPPDPPRQVAPTVPAKLDEVCVRLLAKKPSGRYASAAHLLHVLDATVEGADIQMADGLAPLVGRATELGQLREVIARLNTGRGGVLVIEGGTGHGKSRLAQEALVEARRLGLAVSWGTNTSPEQRPFEGVRNLYEDLIRDTGGQAPEALEAIFRTGQDSRGAMERWAVYAAFRDLFALDAPRLVVIEDLDRADRATAELFEYLVRNLVGMTEHPALFAFTRLPPGEHDPLGGLVSGLSTGVPATAITLGPLSAAAAEELVLSLVVDDERSRALAQRLHREGEGNPYFIGEMLRGLIDQRIVTLGEEGTRGRVTLDVEVLQDSQLPVPSTLRDAFRERLGALSDPAHRVAMALAVARGEVDLDLLIAATGGSEEWVLGCVDELVRAGVARERHGDGHVRFSLARIRLRDVLKEDSSEEEREGIHRRIGQDLERRYRRNLDVVLESLAHHFERGRRPAKAYPYLVRAAEKLMTRGFVAEALGYLERGLRIEPEAREYLTLDDADRRLAGVMLHRIRALFHLGRWDEAAAAARQADDLAVDLMDHALISGAACERGRIARYRGDQDESERQIRRALAEADAAGDRLLKLIPLYEHGGNLWSKGDLAEARKYWAESLAIAEAYSDAPGLALGYNGLGILAYCQGDAGETRRLLDLAIAVAEEHGLMERLVISRLNLAELYHCTGNIRRGLDAAERTVAQAREVHHRMGIALGLQFRSMMLTDIGRMAEAEDNIDRGLEILQDMGDHDALVAGLVTKVRLLLSIGALDRAEAVLDRCVELGEVHDTEGFLPLVHAWRARVYAMGGQPDRAYEELSWAEADPGHKWPHQRLRLILNLARGHLLLGDRERATELAEEGLRLAEGCGYRYYVLRARRLAMRAARDEAVVARHERVARALARSLAANLSVDDAKSFLKRQGFDG